MSLSVLAIDPGKTSGFARWLGDELKAWHETEFVEAAWQIEEHAAYCDLIVCESYLITPATAQKSQQTWSLELIGIARYRAARLGREFVLQAPAEAKKVITDERLRKLGWWTKGSDHARDATRHLALALLKRRLLDAQKLV